MNTYAKHSAIRNPYKNKCIRKSSLHYYPLESGNWGALIYYSTLYLFAFDDFDSYSLVHKLFSGQVFISDQQLDGRRYFTLFCQNLEIGKERELNILFKIDNRRIVRKHKYTISICYYEKTDLIKPPFSSNGQYKHFVISSKILVNITNYDT